MKNIMRTISVVAVLLVLPLTARAVQRGPQEFRHVQLGVHPLGFQLDDTIKGWYKLAFDISGRLGGNRVSVWLGGGLNYSVSPGISHDIQPWMFLMLTFERMIRIPLVPLIKMGLGTDIFPGGGGVAVATLAFRVVVGFHYWVVRSVGLGLETGFTGGPTFNNLNNNNPVQVNGYGQWDTVFGVRFAF
jgi:hypothetical protein